LESKDAEVSEARREIGLGDFSQLERGRGLHARDSIIIVDWLSPHAEGRIATHAAGEAGSSGVTRQYPRGIVRRQADAAARAAHSETAPALRLMVRADLRRGSCDACLHRKLPGGRSGPGGKPARRNTGRLLHWLARRGDDFGPGDVRSRIADHAAPRRGGRDGRSLTRLRVRHGGYLEFFPLARSTSIAQALGPAADA